MKAGKNLFWITIELLFLLAGGLVSYGLGWLISWIVSTIATFMKFLPGTNIIAEILSGMGIVLHIIIMIIIMIYFWSKYEDKTIIKNFKESFMDMFMTLKNKDYSREKEIIGEYSRKVKNAASDCKNKFKESIINGKKNQDENVDDSQDLTKETVSEDSN